MTVAELIAALQAFPDANEVVLFKPYVGLRLVKKVRDAYRDTGYHDVIIIE